MAGRCASDQHGKFEGKEGDMQIDMHYGAVYFLACLAGIGSDEAEKISWSSQFVDDSEFGGTVQFRGGEGCICSNSAHRYLTDNISAHGRLVWIPYHFVPDSRTQGSFLDRLKCKKDSDLARAAVQHALNEPDAAIRPYRFGVALHAYADTWSHYEFSGLWSDANLVDQVELINSRQNVWETVKAFAGTLYSLWKGRQESSLGHLLADVCPDLPYLQWRYHVSAGSPRINRDNPKDYGLALEAMYRYMLQYRRSTTSPGIPRAQWKVLKELLGYQEDKPLKRLARWSDEIYKHFNIAIPEYNGRKWINDALGQGWRKDKCIIADTSYYRFLESHYWRFCEALRRHSDLVVASLDAHGMYLV
jgi:hypothetical protein